MLLAKLYCLKHSLTVSVIAKNLCRWF